MTNKQPEALRLADKLNSRCVAEFAAELRRQHAEIETLRMGYAAARLEIESLRGQLRGWVSLPGDMPEPGKSELTARLFAQVSSTAGLCLGDNNGERNGPPD